jgi:hypothetical protein
MERKRAWITAGVVAVTFTTSALAVMANTGLLAVSPSDRNVGQLTPADITVGSTQPSTSTTVIPEVTVRYEDVYVTLPPVEATPPPVATAEPVAASEPPQPASTRRTTPTQVEREHEETHEGEEDDD